MEQYYSSDFIIRNSPKRLFIEYTSFCRKNSLSANPKLIVYLKDDIQIDEKVLVQQDYPILGRFIKESQSEMKGILVKCMKQVKKIEHEVVENLMKKKQHQDGLNGLLNGIISRPTNDLLYLEISARMNRDQYRQLGNRLINDHNIREIHIHNGMNSKDLLEMKQGLIDNKSVYLLDLRANRLDGSVIRDIMYGQWKRKMDHLQRLEEQITSRTKKNHTKQFKNQKYPPINGGSLDTDHYLVQQLSEYGIFEYDLSDNMINDIQVDLIMNIIEIDQWIKTIDFKANRIQSQGINRILEALMQNNSLISLDTHNNPGHSNEIHSHITSLLLENINLLPSQQKFHPFQSLSKSEQQYLIAKGKESSLKQILFNRREEEEWEGREQQIKIVGQNIRLKDAIRRIKEQSTKRSKKTSISQILQEVADILQS